MAGQAGGQAGRQEQPPKPPRMTPDERRGRTELKFEGRGAPAATSQPAKQQPARTPGGQAGGQAGWQGRQAGRQVGRSSRPSSRGRRRRPLATTPLFYVLFYIPLPSHDYPNLPY